MLVQHEQKAVGVYRKTTASQRARLAPKPPEAPASSRHKQAALRPTRPATVAPLRARSRPVSAARGREEGREKDSPAKDGEAANEAGSPERRGWEVKQEAHWQLKPSQFPPPPPAVSRGAAMQKDQ